MSGPSLPTSTAPTRIALLVDGENMSPVHSHEVLAIARNFGDPTIRRVYGKSEHIGGWDQEGFRLVPTRPGKNAADLLLTVEAMTLALRDGIRTIIIATSDGDFVYLSTQLRELAYTVVGIGGPKAATAFQASCTEFVKIAAPKVFHPPTAQVEPDNLCLIKAGPTGPKIPKTRIIPLIRKALTSANLRGSWCKSSDVQKLLLKSDPNFNVEDFGHISLESLIEAVGYFDLDHRGPDFLLRYPKSAQKPTPAKV
jgi:hypothetical protein